MNHRFASWDLPADLVIATNHSVASMPGRSANRFTNAVSHFVETTYPIPSLKRIVQPLSKGLVMMAIPDETGGVLNRLTPRYSIRVRWILPIFVCAAYAQTFALPESIRLQVSKGTLLDLVYWRQP